MMRLAFAVLAMLLAPIAMAVPFDAAMNKDMPKDIAAFLDRDGMCWHFAGEEATDAVRAKEIAQETASLKCAHAAKKEALLRQKYRDNDVVLKRLDAADAVYK